MICPEGSWDGSMEFSLTELYPVTTIPSGQVTNHIPRFPFCYGPSLQNQKHSESLITIKVHPSTACTPVLGLTSQTTPHRLPAPWSPSSAYQSDASLFPVLCVHVNTDLCSQVNFLIPFLQIRPFQNSESLNSQLLMNE